MRAAEIADRLRPYFKTRPRTAAPTRRPQTAPSQESASPQSGLGPTPAPGSADPELLRRREEAARELAELQWDLGGITYEMAIRDHFRMDVVVRQAARLQAVDAELAAIDRMLRMEDAAAAGGCQACGALYARGAVYCWQCGSDLMGRAAVGGSMAQPATQTEPAPAVAKPQHLPDAHPRADDRSAAVAREPA